MEQKQIFVQMALNAWRTQVRGAEKFFDAMSEDALLKEIAPGKNSTRHFEKMSADEWFAKHTAMTDEDLVREPWRNKLSVLINRTNHLAYHLGQLVLTK